MAKKYNTIDGLPLFYIYSPAAGKIICMCRYVPDENDIASRGEIAIEHDEIIPLEFAHYDQGEGKVEKVVPDVQETIEQEDYRLIMNEMVKATAKRLKDEEKLKSDYWKNYDAQPFPTQNPRVEVERSRREVIRNNKDMLA